MPTATARFYVRRRLLKGAGSAMLALMTNSGTTHQASASSQARCRARANGESSITLFLCGDVMTGRGIDQVLPHPADPTLHEPFVTSARDYVALAERANGPIAWPVDFSYVWGDALYEWTRRDPDLRIVNLETTLTRATEPVPKGINYKMSPDNVPCLGAAGIDCCTLANNHVLDWGQAGLTESLETLEGAKLAYAGAGRDLRRAWAPAILDARGTGRILVFAAAAPSSGVPSSWAAAEDRPGIAFLPRLTAAEVRRQARRIAAIRKPGDIVIVSLHWGGNWGYEVPDGQRMFAHGLIEEAGVDIVHGHSSHHAKGIEVHRGKLILYGCGDFINDYEGISGHGTYRSELPLMYFVTLAPASGQLLRLEMVPMRLRKFRLQRASRSESLWLRNMLNREGASLATRVEPAEHHALELCWAK
ncbi:MAG: CapA family protein [Alphaproteobacteria bacterium]|jgi:poly-gamma-glutamate synthesis protein (capsule biosynthesis protein)|nr:CapA family protein [Alphaproteobacteria bacterium]